MIPLYLITATLFLVIDAIVLTLVMKPLFESHIGGLMRESPMLAAAAGFYLAYVAGWFTSSPSRPCARATRCRR